MQLKKGRAEVHIGNRVISLPIHEELEMQLIRSENSLKLDPMEMTRFLRGYLSRRTCEICLKIKDVEIDFSIPAWLADALELEIDPFIPEDEYSDDFGQIIRNMIPSDIRPPSEKQLSYAKRIAVMLEKELTEENKSSVSSCSDFIDKNLPAFHEKQSTLRSVYAQARKAARGYAAFCLVSISGEVTEEVLAAMKVTQKATIEKYLSQFQAYLDEYQKMEQNIQQISMLTINEFLQEYYDTVVFPELDGQMLDILLSRQQLQEVEEAYLERE
ncbi:hypothetical protein E2X65_24185 [Salmonella enterica]|nr:hypothetical protein [Salmonella enterica]